MVGTPVKISGADIMSKHRINSVDPRIDRRRRLMRGEVGAGMWSG
jgi:hypothetical protein